MENIALAFTFHDIFNNWYTLIIVAYNTAQYEKRNIPSKL